ncbi:MAG: PspC domain-containing protein [Bacteroidales bacterium]|nr:PspC domain-containing protein [Bacteroidales bacterium]
MDKTININLGGTLFQIDEEAYRMLRNYLQEIDRKFRNTPGGNETIEDIETRIAEIFQSQKGTAGIISVENVVDMIRVLGKPEDFEQPEAGSVGTGTSFTGYGPGKKLFRNPENRIIGGVCGGLGAFINTDPVWIRILFVIAAFFFGTGVFVYLALWLAVPVAAGDSQRKEMYGSRNNLAMPGQSENNVSNKVGSAIDASFKAVGNVLFVIVRIFLIAFGVCFVAIGFLSLLTFVMVTVFNYPGAFSTDAVGFSISYLPDFLNYIISPALVPWVKALIALVVTIPLLMIIYGGIRLIFWFRARDGYIWLAGFVVWVMSAAALSIMLFNEGIGFAEKGRTTYTETMRLVPDTLFIRSGVKIADLRYDKEIVIPEEENDVFYINDEKKEIYFRTDLDIYPADEKQVKVEVRKSSAGRSRLDAERKSERLMYNFRIENKTITLDEFFTIPAGTKWSFDFVEVNISVPQGTLIYMDKTTERLFHSYEDDDFVNDPVNRYWKMTEDGLDYLGPDHSF